MATYQGKTVKVLRPAKAGDPGFAQGGEEQVVIKGDDGRELVVLKSQVKDD